MKKAILVSSKNHKKPVIADCIRYNGENMVEIEKEFKPYELYERLYSTGFRCLSVRFSVHNSGQTVNFGDWFVKIDTWRDIVPQYDFYKSYEIIDA